MHNDIADTSSTDPVPGDDQPAHGQDVPDLRVFVFVLFFVFGGITSLNDILIPKLKELFTLSHAQAMLVQSAFFAAYFLVSLPAAWVVRRIGYLRTAALGVLVMALGCLLFIPAARIGVFGVFLGALFVLAAGITTVQVVANPLISMLGKPRTAHSRLTFAQAFNSLGTTLFPYAGALLILAPLAGVSASSLTGVACAALMLLLVSVSSQGAVSAWTLLAIGLCNSIMFPTIFSLASEGLGHRAAEGSGIICMAIVGGAIIPPLTGHLADLFDLRLALLLPAVCYALIGAYGAYARRPAI